MSRCRVSKYQVAFNSSFEPANPNSQLCAGDASWQFPQTEHIVGETMRQTAERAVKETVQEGPQIYFVGNSPMGHVEQCDTKAFFHKAQLIKGLAALKQDAAVVDFAWIAKDEMPNYIQDEATQTLLLQMLGN